MSLAGYSDYETIVLSKTDDQILVVRLHREGGPLTFALDAHKEWVELWKEIAEDYELRLVIITGTGEAFTPPRDMPGGADRASLMTPTFWQRIMRESTDHVMKFLEIPVPVIVAVNGPMRTHAELAFLSDIVIATPDMTIQDSNHFPEQAIPCDVQHVILPALIGRLRAMHYLYTDRLIRAEEAKQLGLINEIVPREKLMERAFQIARWMMRQPAANLRYFRRISTHELRRKMTDMVELGLAFEGLAIMSADWSNWKPDYDGLPPISAD